MNNLGFLSLAARMVVNVHDLNNEGSIGQTTDIRTIRMVDEEGKELPEVPAVSGRMLKHWHLEYMLREELNNSTPKLCAQCKTWEPERQPTDEVTGIQNCVICDTHGFLCAKKKGAGETKGKSLRRSSCVNFSWLLPVIGIYTPSKQVIHSRVAPGTAEMVEEMEKILSEESVEEAKDTNAETESLQEEGKKKPSQMIFYKNYASSIYAFVCSINLNRIGKPLIGDVLSDANEIKRRQKLAIKALFPMVLGAFGASQSHALPHTRCLGLLVALSDISNPIPNLISPIYKNGFKESVDILKALGSQTYWGYGDVPVDNANKKDNIQALFDAVLTKI